MTAAILSGGNGLCRLTPSRVHDVLDAAIAQSADLSGQQLLSHVFLDGLRQAAGARSIRVLEPGPTGVRLMMAAGPVGGVGVIESVLAERLREPGVGFVQHSQDEISQARSDGTLDETVSYYTVFTELAPGIGVVLELCFDAGRGLAEWSDTAGEIFADLRRRELVLQHRRLLDRLGILETLIEQLHQAATVPDLLHVLTTDSAAALGCFRVAVCERSAGSWKLAAATGGITINERADEVRRICSEVQTAESRKPTDGVKQATPAAESVNLGNSNAPLFVVPLSADASWDNARYALHLEYRAGAVRDAIHQDRIIRHAVLALQNRGVLSRAAPRGLVRRSLLPAVLAGLITVACLAAIPVELAISASGFLQPAQRRSVYAEESGIVDELLVQDGSQVNGSDLMFRLRNDELLLQKETVLGELSGVQARQAALDALRSGRDAQQSGVLPGEPAELAARGKSLRQQLEILERRIASLEVRAPLTGQVLTEDLQERFSGRPVQRGQHLCDLGNLHGEWELRLHVSELEIRHVLAAAGSSPTRAGTAPEIRFCIETNPDSSCSVPLATVSGVTEVDERGQTVTAVTAVVPADELEGLRPGAGVRAVIHCGSAPAGYVCFRKLIDMILRQTLL